jgi:hypothetical protein
VRPWLLAITAASAGAAAAVIVRAAIDNTLELEAVELAERRAAVRPGMAGYPNPTPRHYPVVGLAGGPSR